MYWQMDMEGRDRDARKLTSYLGRDGQQLRDRTGEPMSDREVNEFVARSGQYNHEKQIVISPADGEDMSNEEMSLAARRNMNEFVKDRPTAEYCYAIHRDTDNPHVQVAVTGTKRDLYADKQERMQMRTKARDQFGERDRQHGHARRERARQREEQRRRERQQQRERDRDHGREL